ncbi:MAG TPA: chemotaxis protein CheW [Methylomirabilota bacterium]|nr:chemotaxis protein CheW [Methylomirabilota bacterium]
MAEAPAPVPHVPAEVSQPLLSACLFRLGGALFGVDVKSAREVAVFDDITMVPRGPAHLLGVANLRGTVMPIVDVRAMLGLGGGARSGRAMKALVIRDDRVQVAVAVEDVVGLEPFEEIAPLEPGTDIPGRAFGRGLLRWGGGVATLLDAPGLLEALRAEMRRTEPAGRPAPGEAA